MRKLHYIAIILLLAVLVVPALISTSRANIKTSTTSTQGLVGHWPLDSASNRSTTVTADKTPNSMHGTAGGGVTLGGAADQHGQASRATEFDGNDGTLVGSPTFTTDQHGQAARAIQISSGTSYINLGDLNYINNATKFTLCYWQKAALLNVTYYYFDKTKDANNGIWGYSYFTGTYQLDIMTGGVQSLGYISSSSTVLSTNFNHLCWVYDGAQTGNANRLQLYLNGSQLTLSFVGTIPASIPDLSGSNFTIGKSTSSPTNWVYSDYRIYNRALSATEVTALYNSY